ncbi:MAG: efflux RND transporter periplasmic adaptor subunit [Acidobacteria bacterium]|nr:efflux RND transporter periplasmic adaptor subunit [Acidobacteriota bacterium]
MRRVLILLILGGGATAAYYAMKPGPAAVFLTGIVTTENVIVSSQVGGQIGQLLVKEGDQVQKNQLVAVMMVDELQADRAYYARTVESIDSQVGENEAVLRYEQRQTEDRVQQAEANLAAAISQHAEAVAALESARIAFDRTRKLWEQGVGPEQPVDQTRTAHDAAKARVETMDKQVEAQRAAVALAIANSEQVTARQNRVRSTERQRDAAAAQRKRADVRLSYSEVRAPIGGIVDVRAARAGEVVTPGQPLVTLIDPDDLWVRADIEETYIDRIRIGDPLKFRLPSGEERTGTVFYRAADAGFATQRDVSRIKRDIKTFEIRLRFDNADRRLAVGMTAYVELPAQ